MLALKALPNMPMTGAGLRAVTRRHRHRPDDRRGRTEQAVDTTNSGEAERPVWDAVEKQHRLPHQEVLGGLQRGSGATPSFRSVYSTWWSE